MYRQLAVESPAVCGGSLARSLDDLSRHLFDLGRLEEALAVEWYRQLAADIPVIFNADLLGSKLNTMSCYLSDFGLTAEALDRKQEAAKIQVSHPPFRDHSTQSFMIMPLGLSSCCKFFV